MNIQCEYTAYCFDEACSFIMSMLEQNKEPMYNEIKEEKHYTNFKDLYKNYNCE